jgi:hypothetical protein
VSKTARRHSRVSPQRGSPRKVANQNAIAGAPLARILAGVRALLTKRARVELVDDGIDLCFAGGVDVRCRTCGVAWSVSRTHFRTLTWWNCPRGCPSSTASVGATATAS